MSAFQRYLFRNVLRTLLAIVGGLALIALLTQGLAQDRLDLIIENRQSVVVYLWVSVLATPQIISLLMPIALFFGSRLSLATRKVISVPLTRPAKVVRPSPCVMNMPSRTSEEARSVDASDTVWRSSREAAGCIQRFRPR